MCLFRGGITSLPTVLMAELLFVYYHYRTLLFEGTAVTYNFCHMLTATCAIYTLRPSLLSVFLMPRTTGHPSLQEVFLFHHTSSAG